MKPLNACRKIISRHLVDGEMTAGREIALRIDQTLTQDSTGTMAYLQFEAMGVPRVKTSLSVAYVDHNTLQAGFENADDHLYIQTVAARHGIYFSRPGNGICHQVHLERFAVPGQTLLGSDSHTPTCGGAGMLAIGAGGTDVAVAMSGGPYWLPMPRVCRVILEGRLKPCVSAKDIILEILRRLGVKGGVGAVMEYAGPGLAGLGVPERATIANMGAELGATSSVFPSDGLTRRFLAAQGRESAWTGLEADPGCSYDEEIRLDLSRLEPLAALPHSPGNVAPVAEIAGTRVDQVAIGSCTNSSWLDMMKTARILKGRKIHPATSLVISPGSRQVLSMLIANGALGDMVAAGARILECACGPCIGMGQAPATGAVSLRTFNRNFEGRSGTPSARVYLVSPETAAASALAGKIVNPAGSCPDGEIASPPSYPVDDSMIIPPAPEGTRVEVTRGPNIKPFPRRGPLAGEVSGQVLVKLGDDITTDHIMPSHAGLLPYRSNIPHLARFCLTPCDPGFPERARDLGGGFIVAGTNYGQGSSREHAALVPSALGIDAVLAVSFARIHLANLVNAGILPLVFLDPGDYRALEAGDSLVIDEAPDLLEKRRGTVRNETREKTLEVEVPVSARQAKILAAGGLINLAGAAGKKLS